MKSLVEKETPSKAQQRVDTKVREATVWHQASPKDKVDYFTCCRAVQTRTGMHPLPTYGQSVSLMRTFLAEGHASVLNVADCRVTSDQVPHRHWRSSDKNTGSPTPHPTAHAPSLPTPSSISQREGLPTQACGHTRPDNQALSWASLPPALCTLEGHRKTLVLARKQLWPSLWRVSHSQVI